MFKISLNYKHLANWPKGLSCGQSRSPARTVFIRDVVNKAKNAIFGW